MMANLERIKMIGQGNYGVVYLVKDSQTSKLYALKELKKECSIQTEIMKSLNHPNILKIYNCKEQQSNRTLLLEYVESGDLTNYISQGFQLEQNLIISLLTQTTLALYYCHFENQILHRDIKLENILLTSNGLIKLADFGISKRLTKDQKYAYDNVGTPVTMCPERISNGFYDFKSDIWSLGCVMYQLMAKKKPFRVTTVDHPRQKLREKIVNDKPDQLPSTYSQWLRNLVYSMLSKSSQKRPSSQEILEKKEIQKQLLRLRDKYSEYKSCKYMSMTLENPKTTKFTERQQKQFCNIPISVTESMKTSKSKILSSSLKIAPSAVEKYPYSVEKQCKTELIDSRFYSISLPFFIQQAKKKRSKGE